MKKKIIYLLMILAFFSCAASNKQHWQRVRPSGGWAGKHFIMSYPSAFRK